MTIRYFAIVLAIGMTWAVAFGQAHQPGDRGSSLPGRVDKTLSYVSEGFEGGGLPTSRMGT